MPKDSEAWKRWKARLKFVPEMAEAKRRDIFGRKWWLRPTATDEHEVNCVFKDREYKYASITEDDVWLDAGANIGAFTVYVGPLCKGVISVEPSVGNAHLLRKNIELNELESKVIVYEAALVGRPRKDGKVAFYLATTGAKASHSLKPTRGRTRVVVDAVTIDDLLTRHRPTKIKLDIEGGEVEAIREVADELLDPIQEVIMEFHPKKVGDKQKAFRVIDEKLRRHLPRSNSKPPSKTHTWPRIYCWKKG